MLCEKKSRRLIVRNYEIQEKGSEKKRSGAKGCGPKIFGDPRIYGRVYSDASLSATPASISARLANRDAESARSSSKTETKTERETRMYVCATIYIYIHSPHAYMQRGICICANPRSPDAAAAIPAGLRNAIKKFSRRGPAAFPANIRAGNGAEIVPWRRWQFPISARKWRGCHNISRGRHRSLRTLYVSLLGASAVSSPLLLLFQPPLRRRRRSSLSGVSDGYEILRAAAAKWYPRGKLFPRRLRLFSRIYYIILIDARSRSTDLRYTTCLRMRAESLRFSQTRNPRRHYSIVEAAQIAPWSSTYNIFPLVDHPFLASPSLRATRIPGMVWPRFDPESISRMLSLMDLWP